MSCLLNRSAVRSFILAKIEAMRPGLASRVSGKVLDQYEARLRSWIVEDVQRHPSRGKTFVDSFCCETAGVKEQC